MFEFEEHVKTLVHEVGMKNVLEVLIEIAASHDDDYLQRLREDLETALNNYEGRYENEI